MNAWERSLRQERNHELQPRSKTPSFSSSLLDAIYRSIDESKSVEQTEESDESVFYRSVTKKQRNAASKRSNFPAEDEESLRKAIMFEKWMENNEDRSRIVRGSSGVYNSASSSSESSCGGVFSSSETESGSKLTGFTLQRDIPKSEFEQTPKHDGRILMRTKSKALKIYGDLKKVNQPISPGRRITNFLNSLFNVKINAKREPNQDMNPMRKSRSVKDHTTSSCSLSSSFSRSCLSKPSLSSSRAKSSSNNGGSKSKRSVRFSIVVDEDSRPCGHKCVYESDPSLMPTPIVRKFAENTMLEKINGCQLGDFEDEDEEADGMSCASSDLFELENIGAIGAYREELPVYGTTSLKTHLAIANRLVL